LGELGPFLISDEVKAIWIAETQLETVKTINTPRKINAVLLNIKINRPKLANMCGYKLTTNWQNFADILFLYVSENIAKVFFAVGATFLTHTVDSARRTMPCSIAAGVVE